MRAKPLVLPACFGLMLSMNLAVGVRAEDPVPAEDETGKVFAGLAELAILRNDVGRRYALLVSGEKHRLEGNAPPTIQPFYALRSVDRETAFDYMGFDDILPVEKTGRSKDYHRWTEIVRCGGTLRAFRGLVKDVDRYLTKPEPVPERNFLLSHYIQGSYVDPFDDILLVATDFQSRSRNHLDAQERFLRKATFLSSRFVVNDNVESEWELVFGELNFRITLLQSAAFDYLPIEVKYDSQGPNYKDFFSHTRIDWARRAGHWLPVRVECACPTYRGKNLVLNQFFMRFFWVVGEDWTDDFARCEAEDYRTPLLRHFGIGSDHPDDVKPLTLGRWIRPDDLYFELHRDSSQ